MIARAFPSTPAPGPPRSDGAESASRLTQVGAASAALGMLAVLWWADIIRPGSFRRRQASDRRDVSVMPWWSWLAAAAAVYAAQVFGVIVGGTFTETVGLRGGRGGEASAEPLAGEVLTLAAAYAAAVGTGVLLILILARSPAGPTPSATGIRVRGGDAIRGLAWFLAAVPMVLAVNMIAGEIVTRARGVPPDPIAHSTLRTIAERRDDPWTWGLVVAAAVGAPLAEEIMYRVFVQSGLLRLFRSAWPAILLTSVVFAAMHGGVAPTHALPGLFVFSVCLGVAYERSRRLGVPIVMHALFNAVNLAMVLAG